MKPVACQRVFFLAEMTWGKPDAKKIDNAGDLILDLRSQTFSPLNTGDRIMSIDEQEDRIDFTVNKKNLYREESITDLNVASIRRLIPVNMDGSEDKTRSAIYVGHTQLMSPQGPVPIQARLLANNLEEAIEQFPQAMKQSLDEVMEQIMKFQEQQEKKGREEDSRIIIPGRR